jgi:copper(I)-binding protein
MRENMPRLLPFVLLAVVGLARAEGAINAADAWLRGVPPGQENSAAYMTLVNTSASQQTVVEVSSPQARAVEIHESWQADGMWRMRRLEELPVPAGGKAVLQPGGVHLMVFGLVATARPGEKISFQLRLGSGETVWVEAEVRAPGQ